MSFIESMGKLDRRWIYLTIALAVIIPLALGVEFPVKTTPIVQNIFDAIEALPPGSRIMVTADYGPSTVPENQPMFESVSRHVLHKGHKLYALTIWATGPDMISQMQRNVIDVDFADLTVGEDWVNLGYKAGNQGVINSAFQDFWQAFPTDVNGNNVANVPMMAHIKRLEDFDLIVAIGSGVPGVKEWIQFGGDPANVPMAGGVTAVEAPLLYPYYPSQLIGLMGGLQGAAEYEAALVTAYPQFTESSQQAIKNMGPQTIAHLVIIMFIVLGNLAYFLSGRKETKLGVKN
jgi:hypothetical protein